MTRDTKIEQSKVIFPQYEKNKTKNVYTLRVKAIVYFFPHSFRCFNKRVQALKYLLEIDNLYILNF